MMIYETWDGPGALTDSLQEVNTREMDEWMQEAASPCYASQWLGAWDS